MTAFEVAIVLIAGLIAIAAVLSSIYIVRVYRDIPDGPDKREALFLSRLVARDVRVSIASSVILGYIVMALTNNAPGRPWGSLIISVAVGLMMIGPISDAVLWFKERRKR